MNKTLVARSRSVNWNKAFSMLLTVVLLVSWMVMVPAPEASPRAQQVLLGLATESPEEMVGVIVQKLVKDTSLEELVARMGGVVTKDLYIINAFAAELPVKAVPELAKAVGVRWVSLDAPVVEADGEDVADDGSGGIMTVRDEFDVVSYSDNDGAVNWTGDWVEIGESDGPAVGDIAITSFLGGTRQGLRIQNANKGVWREANLSGAASAMLSFDYRRKGFDDSSDYVAVEISADGGASWIELDRFAGPATDPDVQLASYDISSHVSSNTAIRLVSSWSLGEQGKLYIDNVQIEYTLADGSSLEAIQGEPALSGDSLDVVKNEFQLVSGEGSGGGVETVRDEFNTVSYSNNDGTQNWFGNWVEDDPPGGGAGPTAGQVQIIAGELRLDDCPDTGGVPSAARKVDLSGGVTAATFSFDFRTFGGVDTDDAIAVEVSNNGGANYTVLETITGIWGATWGSRSYDITGYISAGTTIRFRVANKYGGENEFFFADNVQIEYTSGVDDGDETVRDEFNAVSYSNNDGTANWSGDWVEIGESDGPYANDVAVATYLNYTRQGLRIRNHNKGARREVDLSGATSAVLSFEYHRRYLDGPSDYVALEISADGGASWTELDRFRGPAHDGGVHSVSYDISGYASSNTAIRFISSSWLGSYDDRVYFDNVQVEYAGGCAECIDTSNLVGAYIRAIGADGLWNEALYLQGQGVTVAVVDSGIAPHDDLLDGVGDSRVVAQVDFTGGQGLLDDFYGHGSHVAGTIGGNGARSDGAYIGVAPKVDLVDVKVIDDYGTGTTSDVVAGLQWIYENKAVYDVRVVNLSLNSSVAESYDNSPLDAALEILWFNGIVVVVSAGNNGSGALYPPANDPFVIVAGSADDLGTADIADDVLSSFSAYGMTVDGFGKPDLVAPGRDIISLLASDDCNLALDHPAHAVPGPDGNYYFRMSGTSTASAVTAGAVALLLQDEPGLTPDQVKYRLMATVRSFDGPEPSSTGAGYLDIYAAVHGVTTGSANTAKITFTSHRDGNSEIYVMDAGGSNQTRLTNNAASDDRPAWSPDRSKIAFASDRNGNWEIYVMGADGSHPINLTNNAANDRYPVWSPDGSQIAFYRYYPDNWEIYVMDADGANQTRLTFNAVSDSYPAWSPDGSQIAFHSDRDGNYEVYVMGADGSNQTNLTNNRAEDGAPAWSPDGSQIAFRSMRDGNKEIYVMGPDGSNQTRLTSNAATDNDPAWSPDGSQIAFHSDRDGNYEIYVMNADGSSPTRLINNAANDLEPDWSPGVVPHQLLAKMALIVFWASENGGGCIDWESVNWDSVNWDSVNWDSVNWDSVNWDSVNWDSVNWDSVNWDSVNWDSVNWDSVNWDSVNWDSVNWDSVNWDSVNWDSVNWDSVNWDD
ncbi:MAG: S8 family serine peptidase [Anaerolineae bacterium]